jgi:Ca-activated chloride channel family protein
MGFEFHWPWMGLLILLPLLVRVFLPVGLGATRQRPEQSELRQRTLLHPGLAELGRSFNVKSRSASQKGPWHALLSWLLFAMLVLALMRPQWIERVTQTRTEGYDVMLAIDASHSMEALDFSAAGRQVTRMAVLKGVVDKFISGRAGDRVGLIVFGSYAYTIVPLSTDIDTVRFQLNDVQPNIAGPGTALGDAIGLGVLRLRERPPGGRVLILVADGGNSSGTIPPLEAARMAAFEHIRVYAIGVGSREKLVPILEEGQIVEREDLGIDEDLLRDVAKTSGGAYFRATNPDALNEIYQQIGQLEKTKAETRSVFIPHSLHQVPIGLALLFALLLGLFPDGRLRLPARLGERSQTTQPRQSAKLAQRPRLAGLRELLASRVGGGQHG